MNSKTFDDGVEFGIETLLNMSPEQWTEEREEVARAMHEADQARYVALPHAWDRIESGAQDSWRYAAEAAMKKLGYQLVSNDG